MTVRHWLAIAQGNNRLRVRRHHPVTGATDQQHLGVHRRTTRRIKKQAQRRAHHHSGPNPGIGERSLVSPIQPTALQQPTEVAIGIAGILTTNSELFAGGLQATQLKSSCGTPRVANDRNGIGVNAELRQELTGLHGIDQRADIHRTQSQLLRRRWGLFTLKKRSLLLRITAGMAR